MRAASGLRAPVKRCSHGKGGGISRGIIDKGYSGFDTAALADGAAGGLNDIVIGTVFSLRPAVAISRDRAMD